MPTIGQLESFVPSARLVGFDLAEIDPVRLGFALVRDAFFFAIRFEAMATFYFNCGFRIIQAAIASGTRLPVALV